MMKKIVYIALAAAGLLTGCSNEINEMPTDRVAAEFSEAAITRATATAWESDDKIGVYMVAGGATLTDAAAIDGAKNISHTVANTSTGAFAPTTAAQQIYFPVAGSAVDFYAYYPYQAAMADGIYKVDVSDQSSQPAIDLLTAKVADKTKSTPNVALQFSHRLSKLSITASAGDGLSATDLAGLTVTIKGLPATADYNIGTGAVSNIAATTTDISARMTGTSNLTAEAIVIPQTTITTGSVQVVFALTNGLEFGWNLTAASLISGSNYTYNIKLNRTGVTLTSQNIAPWGTGNGDNGEEGTAVMIQPVSNSYMITPEATETKYYIPVSRVNEFWKATETDAICPSANVAANVIGATDPWTVSLLWQDVDSLVSATDKNEIVLSKASGKGADDYFTLTVPAGYAGRGNFVIAIAKGTKAPKTNGTTAGPATGAGAILWSWHFWVTDKPSEITPPAEDETVYPTFMDRNMGARSVYFPTYQVTTDNKTVKGALYYQFGRKDPFPADVALYYDINGNTVTYSTAANAVEGQKTMAYAVNNPLQFIMRNSNPYNWCSELAAGSDTYLWNDPNATDKSKKSLFDPTPAGYRMPINREFNFMSSANSTWVNKGRKHTSSGLYFPAVGTRYVASGAMSYVTGLAYCWSSSPHGATNGFYLYAFSTNVYPQNNNNRAYGFPVRCVQE